MSKVLAAQEAEIKLLKSSRQLIAYRLTQKKEFEDAALQEEKEIEAWLQQTLNQNLSPGDRKKVETLHAVIQNYITTRKETLNNQPLDNALEQMTPLLENALKILDQFVTNYRISADQTLEASAEMDRLSERVALIFLLIAVFGMLLVNLVSHLYLHRPLIEIHHAIDSFSRGNRAARAPNHQRVKELVQIAKGFNSLASQTVEFDQRRSQFLAGTAHDLKNPLTAIKMSVQLLRLRYEQFTDSQKKTQLDLVERQVIRLENMVASFMDAIRIEAGEFTLDQTRTNLSQTVTDLVDLWKNTSTKHVIIAKLPNTPVVINCDPMRLEQIVTNLLSNAIKYSPQGGEIEVCVTEKENHIELNVQDQGIGIAEDEIPKIFDPFHRSISAQQVIPGFGIGLWVAKRLIEAHHGSITVDSQLGKGSKFCVFIPKSRLANHSPKASLARSAENSG